MASDNYVGIQTQIRNNNKRTTFMLIAFPLLVAFLLWLLIFLILTIFSLEDGSFGGWVFATSGELALQSLPWVMVVSVIWFGIAYLINMWIIKRATGSHTLDRQDNKRIYNLVENLCMSQGMPMPKINVIEDSSLNAFASGINEKTYTVTLTRGIMESLDDEELEGVIAHELMHIRNRDVRLLIITIVFVGIFTVLAQVVMNIMFSRGKKNIAVILIGLLVVSLGYLLSSLMRFSISRKREYMADAGAAMMTKKPQALASALRKISGRSEVSTVTNEAVSQLFIESALKSKKKSKLFSTHPPIDERIRVLEQF